MPLATLGAIRTLFGYLESKLLMQTAKFGLGRGVYVAPWMGPKGEIVLIALTRFRKLAGEPFVVPIGSSHVLAGDALWERLEHDDPIPRLQII